MKTYKSVEEVKAKSQDGDSLLRRNGSGKKVCLFSPLLEVATTFCLFCTRLSLNCLFLRLCVLLELIICPQIDGTRGASVTSQEDMSSTKNGGKLRRGSSGRGGVLASYVEVMLSYVNFVIIFPFRSIFKNRPLFFVS